MDKFRLEKQATLLLLRNEQSQLQQQADFQRAEQQQYNVGRVKLRGLALKQRQQALKDQDEQQRRREIELVTKL